MFVALKINDFMCEFTIAMMTCHCACNLLTAGPHSGQIVLCSR